MSDDLEASLAAVKKEFDDGELTVAGYNKRAMRLETLILERDLTAGDLTEQGYSRKKARLDTVYSESKKTSDVAESLSNPSCSIRQKISNLFGRNPDRGASGSLAGFNPSGLHVKKSKQPAKSQKSLKLKKKVAVVWLQEAMFSVPKRKSRDKLNQEGRVKEILIAAEDGVATIKDKINKVFPGIGSVSILSVTTGSDVTAADLPEDQTLFGEAVFELVDSGSLYVKSSQHLLQNAPLNQQPTTSIHQHATASCQPHPSAIPQVVAATVSRLPSAAPRVVAASCRPLPSATPRVVTASCQPLPSAVPHVATATAQPLPSAVPHVATATAQPLPSAVPHVVTATAQPLPSAVPHVATAPLPSAIPQVATTMYTASHQLNSPPVPRRPSIEAGAPQQSFGTQYVVGPRVFAVVLGSGNPTANRSFDSGTLESQLFDPSTYRLWRECSRWHAMTPQDRGEEEIMCEYSPDEIPLSKDVDVIQWADYRRYRGHSPLREEGDFVIVNNSTMSEFLKFKATHTNPMIIELPRIDLLDFYFSHYKQKIPNLITKYGQMYISLTMEEVDELCEWVIEAREKIIKEGRKSVFES